MPEPAGLTTRASRPSEVRASASTWSEAVEPPYPGTSSTGPGRSWGTGSTAGSRRTTTTTTRMAATAAATASAAAPRTSRRRAGARERIPRCNPDSVQLAATHRQRARPPTKRNRLCGAVTSASARGRRTACSTERAVASATNLPQPAGRNRRGRRSNSRRLVAARLDSGVAWCRISSNTVASFGLGLGGVKGRGDHRHPLGGDEIPPAFTQLPEIGAQPAGIGEQSVPAAWIEGEGLDHVRDRGPVGSQSGLDDRSAPSRRWSPGGGRGSACSARPAPGPGCVRGRAPCSAWPATRDRHTVRRGRRRPPRPEHRCRSTTARAHAAGAPHRGRSERLQSPDPGRTRHQPPRRLSPPPPSLQPAHRLTPSSVSWSRRPRYDTPKPGHGSSLAVPDTPISERTRPSMSRRAVNGRIAGPGGEEPSEGNRFGVGTDSIGLLLSQGRD